MTYISQAEYVAGTSPVYMVYCVSTLRTISRADVSPERLGAAQEMDHTEFMVPPSFMCLSERFVHGPTPAVWPKGGTLS
jgi:hypothetical protein